MDLKYFYISMMAVLVGLASAFQGEISITGDKEIGDNVTITCSWTLSQNEGFVNVILRSLPVPSGANPYYYQFNNGLSFAVMGSQSNNRTSAENPFNASSQRAVVRITNVQCADDRNYSCYFSYALPNSAALSYEKTSYLTVKARPKTPTVRLPPNINTDLLESSNISVVCAANVGLSGKGSLQWKIYRSGVLEVVPATDSRLGTLNNVSLEAGEGSCTQRVQQTFSMIVSRADQNLTIACFVQNDDFQNQVPDVCQTPSTDFCAKTQPFRIVYGVNETSMNVGSDPPGEVYQDKALTLTCKAAGLPAPVYTWVQVLSDNSTDTDNNTSSGELVDDRYQLVLRNLVSYGGQELKYACTAKNTVLGQTYSVTKEITIQVLMTTTTRRTTTTTTTPTTQTTTLGGSQSGNGTGAHSGDSDDQTKTIIIAVVVVGSILIIALIVGIILWRRRQTKKQIEEPSEKPYNNRTNLSYQHSQPDLVADKKFTSPSLDNSFSEKKEDGLMYADLTYDNKPRSRKPMAITDTSSEYSDIQMPQV